MAQSGEHLDLVRLELLARAAAVALLAARAGRASIASRSSTSPAGSPLTIATSAGPCDSPAVVELEGHVSKPTASRMTSTGAGTPVQSSNDAAPWRDEHLETGHDARAGRARGRGSRRLAGTGGRRASGPACELDDDGSSRSEVALTTRSASATSGGQSPRREKTGARLAAPRTKRAAAPPSPRIAGALGRQAVQDRRVGREPLDAARRERRACSPTATLGRRRARSTASLCGVVTFAPANPSAARPRTASSSRSGGDRQARRTPSRARRAAKAAFCIARRERVPTGLPSSPTSRVVRSSVSQFAQQP